MSRPRLPPRTFRRTGRKGWYAYLDRETHVSLKAGVDTLVEFMREFERTHG
jgi:hypothetical protein